MDTWWNTSTTVETPWTQRDSDPYKVPMFGCSSPWLIGYIIKPNMKDYVYIYIYWNVLSYCINFLKKKYNHLDLEKPSIVFHVVKNQIKKKHGILRKTIPIKKTMSWNPIPLLSSPYRWRDSRPATGLAQAVRGAQWTDTCADGGLSLEMAIKDYPLVN